MVAVVHGLAASIRSAEESETFDLAGQNATTISSTILSAFQEPFLRQAIDTSTNMMLRITLIVGAGKQARQKYDDNATKAVVTALTSCGYTEDRAASCIMDCAGCYKLQHDTAKNVKTIVIFPKMNIITSDQSVTTSNTDAPPFIPMDSPDYKIAIASMPVFTNMIKSKCQSLMQKKVCLQCIEKLIQMIENLDTKLISGTGLNESEQAFYDIVCNLDSKIKFLRDEISKQIDCGQITKYEKDLLLQQNSEKINELMNDNSNSKKQLLDKALQRKQKLEGIVPMEKEYKLKYDTEIRALQKDLVPLLQFYEKNKNKLLNNVQDSYKMTRKDEIEREIIQFEQSSRGWFEDDNEFRSKVQASRDVLTTAVSSNSKKQQQAIPKSYAAAIGRKDSSSPDKSSGLNANSKPGTKWVLPTEMGKTSKSAKAKKRQGGGSLFGAMMMDSDSEEDDDVVAATKTMSSNMKAPAPNPNVELKQKKSVATTTTIKTSSDKKKNVFSTITIEDDSDSDEKIETLDDVTTSPRTSASQQNGGDQHSKKKKSKKKSNTQKSNSIDDDKVLNEEFKKVKRREDKAIAAKKKERENEHMIVSIIRVTGTIIVEMLMVVILWVVQHVFGRGNVKPKKQKQ